MDNLAYDEAYEAIAYEDREPDYELIGGVKYYMAAASPFINHALVAMQLGTIFTNYIKEHNIYAVAIPEIDVYLDEKHHCRPDLIVLRDLSKISTGGERIYGAPELVVEVLSKSTMNNDLGPKKAAYEKYGVKEYWIVDPWSKRIEVFHLIDGKFDFKGSFMEYSEDDYDHELLTPATSHIKVSIFDDLTVNVKDVFEWYINTSVKEK